MADSMNNSLDRGYDGLARGYDDRRFTGSAGVFNAEIDANILCEYVKHTGAKIVFDVPVGTGRTAEYLKPLNIRVVGCDLSRDMLHMAKKKVTGLSLDLNLVHADASRLPFSDESVDCLVCLRFFHLFSQKDRLVFMKEFNRVVRPGGYLIISATNAFYGIGINITRKVTKYFNITFLWPGQSRELFNNWKVLASRGNYLPGQHRLKQIIPGFERKVEIVLKRGYLEAICFERFCLLKKRVEGNENGNG
jgi:ubiquinone/menaquinone biosynthesis C-methylase UbiE